MLEQLQVKVRLPLGGTLIALAAALIPAAATAGQTIFFSPERDTVTLSEPCQAKLKGSGPEYLAWEQQLGPDIFIHYHHYCFGLFEMNKGMAGVGLDQQDRMALFRDAVTQFDYVLARYPKDHPLAVESGVFKRMLEMRLGLGRKK